MCRQLCELREALSAWAREFDPSRLLASQAGAVVADAAAIESIAVYLKGVAAGRVAESGGWRHRGFRNSADELAHQAGMSTRQARDALDTAQRLADHEELAGAAASGELSPGQMALIAEAVEVDPAAAGRLVEQAKGVSLAELRDEVARTKASARADLEARRQEIRRKRRLRQWTDTDGAWHLHAAGNVEDGAQVMAALTPIIDETFHAARQEGRREHPDAYAFDALVQLAVEATSESDPDEEEQHGEQETGPVSERARDHPGSPTSEPAGRTRASTQDPAVHSPRLVLDPTPTDPGGPPGGPDSLRAPASPPEDPRPGSGSTSASAGHPEHAAPAHSLGPPYPPAASDGHPPGRVKPARRGSVRRRRGAQVKLLIRIDYNTWLRGVPLDGETCELVGYGPIPVSVVQDMVAMGDPFVAAIFGKGQLLAGVAHLGRQPTAAQQSALEWLYPSCAAQGCWAQARLQRDHRIDWAKTHYTMLDTLDLLCAHHHQLKSRQQWNLVEGHGKRPFVPPTDPRHPHHQPQSAA